MDYCISTWDPRHHGAIEEPHHNTYDIEFWGPDGMHTSFYVGALTAITAMGKFTGDDTSAYQQLAARGRQLLETELYDGEFYPEDTGRRPQCFQSGQRKVFRWRVFRRSKSIAD